MKLLLLFVCFVALCYAVTDKTPVRAELLTTSGCKLNRLPLVKKFIQYDAPDYKDMSVLFVGGDPRVKFYNVEDQEIETLSISKFNVEQIHEFLQEKGFKRTPQMSYIEDKNDEESNKVDL
eukprot:TRINITY_DN11377_c0_g1_i1.p1 TRINITY_DN11377_c0_g1~~TRINITY_DN11377_c0_g1_i1.p1  ORF type:complete len:121 (+),score=22.97 TRINITY_DN11377_c0_g1_i1:1-363(+)